MIRSNRFFDIRAGEGAVTIGAFCALLSIITGHTILETTRDAMFLERLPVRELNVVYALIAVASLFLGRVTSRLTKTVGARGALLVTIGIAAIGTLVLFVFRHHPSGVIALYVMSGVFGAVAVAQFWALTGSAVTVEQGRRLFGLIATAGVLGGVVGSVSAAFLVQRWPVPWLLLVAAGVFGLSAIAVAIAPVLTDFAPVAPEEKIAGNATSHLRAEPFLGRIAVLVAISTATLLAVDYLFKSSVAEHIAPHRLGKFFARFYAAMNVASIFVQVLLAGTIVRRLGVAAAAAVLPLLMLLGSVGTLLLGAFFAVLITKGADGTLRYSVHRVTMELLYLPVSPKSRAAAKPLIDGALSRIVQAITAGVLFAFASLGLLSTRSLAAIVITLSFAWLAAAASMRKPYLDLFRRALSDGALVTPDERPSISNELDLPSLELVVERLASSDAAEVCSAIDVLARWHRSGLLPALILHHHDERVLVRALEVFRVSPRSDWIPLAEKLFDDQRDVVRLAAVRALAARDPEGVLSRASADPSPRTRAYALYCLISAGKESPFAKSTIETLRALNEEDGLGARRGFLAAAADAPDGAGDRRTLLWATKDARITSSPELAPMLARAMEVNHDPVFIPYLIARLRDSAGREGARRALVAIGPPAFAALVSALTDEASERRLRRQLPRTIARFSTQAACDILADLVEHDGDGLVRYKALRGLGLLGAQQRFSIDRGRLEKLTVRNLGEHLRIVALREHVPIDDAEARLLGGILDDKSKQALERAFRLLKIVNPNEDVHLVYDAARSKDRQRRANAMEFVTTLLDRFDESEVRALLAIVVDELPASERVERGARLLGTHFPTTRVEAIAAMIMDSDLTVATLAAHWATKQGDPLIATQLALVSAKRPELADAARWMFEPVAPAHG